MFFDASRGAVALLSPRTMTEQDTDLDLWNFGGEQGAEEDGNPPDDGDSLGTEEDPGTPEDGDQLQVPSSPTSPRATQHTPVEIVVGRGRGRGRGRGSAGSNRASGRGGSVRGRSNWSFQSWVRLVHAVTEDKEAFKQITQGFERHELDAGTNPWDRICEIYNDQDFKPSAHRIACQHPDLRNADPALIGKHSVSAGSLMERWKMFKKELTRWQHNWEASGNHESDKADFAITGTGEAALMCFS